MEIAPGRNVDEPLGEPDDRIGEEVTVREDCQGVAKRGGIFGDLTRSVGRLSDQAIEEVYCIVRIRQRWQLSGYTADRSRGEFSEINKFRARTNRVAELDLVEEIQHYLRL